MATRGTTTAGTTTARGRSLLAVRGLVLLALSSVALADPDPEHAAAPAAAATEPSPPGLTEDVLVLGRRLEEAPAASVSVETIDAELVAAGVGRSLPELLARRPGVAAQDLTGNGRQLRLGLRGFSGESGATALLVDGVRLDGVELGAPPFELLRLDGIESVTIHSGPLGALLGGGSLAGVVRVRTPTPGDDPGWRLGLRLSDDGGRAGRFAWSERFGRLGVRVSAGAERLPVVRGPEDASERDATIGLAHHGEQLELQASWSRFVGDWPHLGSLSTADLHRDRHQLAETKIDFQERRHDLQRVRARWTWDRGELSAQLARRRLRGRTLTTSGGFGYLTTESSRQHGLVVEGSRRLGRAERFELSGGFEVQRHRLQPRAWATTAIVDRHWDDEVLSSDLRVRHERTGAWISLAQELGAGWRWQAALRREKSELGRSGLEVGTGEVDDARSFSRSLLGVGVVRSFDGPRHRGTVELSWGESFLPPSTNELFAFPGFGSNPDLRPVRGRGLSLGTRWSWEDRGTLTAELFDLRVRDEIVFDPAEGLAGRNVNAADTRRRGVQLGGELRLGSHARLDLGWIRQQARYSSDWSSYLGDVPSGASVPLVPSDALRIGLELGPFHDLSVRLDWSRQGRRPVASDFDNSRDELPTLERVDLLVERDVSLRRGGRLRLGLEVENLLDRDLVTWGVETAGDVFLVPGASRRVALRVDWRSP
ncbi:MAG: TonB-dependent receptor [Acidobacteriota bacterium]